MSERQQAIPIEDFNRRISRRRFFRKITIGDSGYSLTDTVFDTVIFYGATIVSKEALKSVGINGTSSSLVNSLKQTDCEKGTQNIPDAIIKAPIMEEAVFRFAPGLLVRDFSKRRWGTGIISSLIFAVAHNFSDISADEEKLRLGFETKSIPIAQFAGGLFFWKMLRERGPIHSILSHMVFNSLGSVHFVVQKCLGNPSNDVQNSTF